MPEPMATMKEFFSGSQKFTFDQSLPSNSFWKCTSVHAPTGWRYRRFSVPRWMVNILVSMVIMGKRDRTTSTSRKNTSSRFAGLVTKARRR